MKSFEQTIYLNREKEENWDIVDQAEELGFTNAQDLLYLGYDIEMNVEILSKMISPDRSVRFSLSMV